MWSAFSRLSSTPYPGPEGLFHAPLRAPTHPRPQDLLSFLMLQTQQTPCTQGPRMQVYFTLP